jgi:hypothetical protein
MRHLLLVASCAAIVVPAVLRVGSRAQPSTNVLPSVCCPQSTGSDESIMLDEWSDMRLLLLRCPPSETAPSLVYQAWRVTNQQPSLLWELRSPYRLERAVLGIRGCVLAYYYDQTTGLGTDATSDEPQRYVGIALIDSAGRLRQDIRVRRNDRRIADTQPSPSFADVIRVRDGTAGLVRMIPAAASGGESWWVFDLEHDSLLNVYSPWLSISCQGAATGRFLQVSALPDDGIVAVASISGLPKLLPRKQSRDWLEFGDTLVVFDVQSDLKRVWQRSTFERDGRSNLDSYRLTAVERNGLTRIQSIEGRELHLAVQRNERTYDARLLE